MLVNSKRSIQNTINQNNEQNNCRFAVINNFNRKIKK